MFIFKFSQLGAQALNRLTTVPSVAVWRSPSLNTPQHRNFQSLMIKRLFSTSDGAQVSGTEEKVRIPKFFIDTEGKEYTVAIKVPVGMSIQQAYQENKIEVEGRSGYVSRRTDLADDEYILVGEADNKYNNKVVRIPSLKKTSVLHIPPNIYLEIPDSK